MSGRKAKRGGKRKIVDPFVKKEWYDVRAPSKFDKRDVGKTVVNRTQGNRVASDSLKGRVVVASLGDLKEDADNIAFRKFKLKVETVQGRLCLTQFHGMELTRDKLCSLVKKWQTLIEAHADVKTQDGFTLRVFCIGFTKHLLKQQRKTSYAQASQVRAIRKRMVDKMTEAVSKCDLQKLTELLIVESIGADIEKSCQAIYPLQNVLIRKVKVLRAPKTDLGRVLEMHGGAKSVSDQASKTSEAGVASAGVEADRDEAGDAAADEK